MSYLRCVGICVGARLPFEDVRFECADLLAVAARRTMTPETAVATLADAVEQSQKVPYWHCRCVCAFVWVQNDL